MSRPYGQLPPGGRKQPEAPQPTEIQVNITLRHTMEQLALEGAAGDGSLGKHKTT